MKRAHKYNAKRAYRCGGKCGSALDHQGKCACNSGVVISFDSIAESRRWDELRVLERAGEITHLCRQVPFELLVYVAPRGAASVGTYFADFTYRDGDRRRRLHVEDCKGVRTPVYRLKKKMVEAQYGIRIEEV